MEAGGEQVSAVNAATNFKQTVTDIWRCGLLPDEKEVIEFDVSNRIKVILEAIEEVFPQSSYLRAVPRTL